MIIYVVRLLLGLNVRRHWKECGVNVKNNYGYPSKTFLEVPKYCQKMFFNKLHRYQEHNYFNDYGLPEDIQNNETYFLS